MNKFLISTIVIVFSLIGSAEACSCIWDKNETVKSHAARSTAIFKGEYLGERGRSVVSAGDLVIGQFRVIDVLKGDVPAAADLEFVEDNGSNCGMRFELGVVYEVFAYEVEGALRTDDCFGTRKADTSSKKWSWSRYKRVLRK